MLDSVAFNTSVIAQEVLCNCLAYEVYFICNPILLDEKHLLTSQLYQILFSQYKELIISKVFNIVVMVFFLQFFPGLLMRWHF